jgi:preprotein translocase subunit SecD
VPATSEPTQARPEPIELVFDPVKGDVEAGALATIRRRIVDLKLSDPGVIPYSDGSIGVELDAADAERVPEVIRALITPGVLGLHVVDSNSAEMRRLHGDVSRRATAAVTAELDTWVDHQGKQRSDPYIKGATRDSVATVFDGIKVAGRTVGLQRFGTGDVPEYWRSYWLEIPAIVTHESIADARLVINPNTQRPEVIVDLEPGAARRFAEATAKNLGRRIAIVLDGEVVDALVVVHKITGGQLSLTMGGGSVHDQQVAAETISRALGSGVVPPLKLRRK